MRTGQIHVTSPISPPLDWYLMQWSRPLQRFHSAATSPSVVCGFNQRLPMQPKSNSNCSRLSCLSSRCLILTAPPCDARNLFQKLQLSQKLPCSCYEPMLFHDCLVCISLSLSSHVTQREQDSLAGLATCTLLTPFLYARCLSY